MSCIFCKIINNEISAELVYKDDKIVSFKDINPRAKVHVLIVPIEHIATLNDLTEDKKDLMGHIVLKSVEIARLLGIESSGYRLIANCGSDAGQLVKHIHFHILGGQKLGPKGQEF